MLARPPAAPGAELTAKQGLMLFPTPMFTGILPDIAVCDRIETKIRALQKSGVGQSSTVGTSTRYLTPDDLHTLPETKELVDIALLESGRILDAFAIKRDSHYITGMWANITHPNHSQHMHVHPNCLLSGLVYIKTPKNCGPTMFASSRRFTKNFEPAYAQRNELNTDFFIVPAEKGRMLLWPSHVPHMVERGTADESEDRITVAFNVMIRGNIELFTSRLVLS
jgi:uncharacterized protein (TIGR02466 family)